MNRRTKSEEDLKKAIALYKSGFSLKEISTQIRSSKSWVYVNLVKAKVPIRKLGRYKGFVVKPETKNLWKISGRSTSENNGLWKGENASYRAKHIWVDRRLGKPHKCEECLATNLKHRMYHWANVSGRYLRELSDWRRLCAKCHKSYDMAQKTK